MSLAPILAARVEVGLRRLTLDRAVAFAPGEAQRLAEAEAARITEFATLLVPDKRERSAVLARASLASTWPIRFEVPGLVPGLFPGHTFAEDCETFIVRTNRAGARSYIHSVRTSDEAALYTTVAILPPLPRTMLIHTPGEPADGRIRAIMSAVTGGLIDGLSTVSPPFLGRWPGNVTAEQVAAALDKAPRTHEHKALATTIAGALRADFLTAAREYDASPLPPLFCAMVLSVLEEVRAELASPMMALDAGQIHHAFVTGTIRAATSEGFYERHSPGRLILAFPDKNNAPDTRLQLELPFTGDAPGQSLINGILRFRSMFGLRNWAALQTLLSKEGRSGRILWRLSDHLDAMGVSPTWRGRARNRKNVLDEVRALASIELVWEPDSKNRIIAPILQTGHKHATKRGEDWEIDGIELTIHPSLYSGVRGADGNPGRMYWPVPATLAALDHERFGPALALGLILPMRFRWDQKSAEEGEAPILRLSAATLLETAGVNEHRKGRGHAPRVLRALDTNLRELVRIGVLASATWEKPGDLRSIVVLRPAAASVDRAVRGLRPPADVHPALVAALPATGAELAAWRKERKLTQGALALALGCSERTIRSAEGAEGERFGRKLAGALRDRFGTSG